MADYKRMVSYMYQYDNGVKKKNIGYVRVESKNGQCKFTLHMQLLGQLDSIFPVYLIQRDNDEMNLIYLGDSILKGQLMDSKLTSADTNICGSGYNLSDIGGMLLFLSEKVFFATEWDDKPITLEQVMKAMKPKPSKENTPEEKKDRPMKERKAVETLAESNQEATPPKEDTVSAAKLAVEEDMDETNIPKYKLPRGWKTIERLQNPAAVLAERQMEPVLPVEGTNQPGANAANSLFEEETSPDITDQIPSDTEMDPGDFFVMPDGSDTSESEMNTQTAAAGTTEEMYADLMAKRADEDHDLPEPPMAARFFDNYPRIYPFEDNEVTLCVKVEPKDIGYLSKEAWALSNNSFLLHGFYSYQHLIFAKLKDRFGCRYILGVPGIFHNREKFMAKMFGFENFKSIRRRELRQGDFGYWYIVILM